MALSAVQPNQLDDVDEPVRRFVRALPIPAYVWKQTSGEIRLAGFNAAAHSYTDGRIERIVGRSVTDLYANRPDILDGFEQSAKSLEPVQADLTFRYVSMNRDERARVTYLPLRSGTVIVLVDPTYPEDARLLQAVIRNLPTGMAYRCLNDKQWTMKAVTSGCRDLTGFSPEDLIDNRAVAFADLVHEDDREALAERVNAAIAGHRPFNVRYRLHSADESVRWVWEQGRLTDEGPPAVLEGLILDITEWRTWEEQVSRLQRIESLGQLTAAIAHDFNNVLSVVLGNAELALNDVERDSAQLRIDLDAIQHAARSGASLVKRLGAFSRSAPLRFEAADLKAAIEDAATLFERLLPANISLVLTLDGDVPRARVDLESLEQMLLNLATNARDAMPHGGTLSVRLSRAALDDAYIEDHPWVAPGPYACITMSDTGTGMPREVRDRIFDPFFTTKAPGKGTGLGLATVFGLVKQHGGYLHVYSEDGAGTAFRVYLPLAGSDVAVRRATAAPEGPPRGQGETVLLVEDDADLRDTSIRVLERLGYTVEAVGTAADALSVLDVRTAAIACVVTDFMLPDRTGTELVAAIQRGRTPSLPCLLMTGYSPETLSESSDPQPDLAVVFKPWTVEEFARAVRDVLDSARPDAT